MANTKMKIVDYKVGKKGFDLVEPGRIIKAILLIEEEGNGALLYHPCDRINNCSTIEFAKKDNNQIYSALQDNSWINLDDKKGVNRFIENLNEAKNATIQEEYVILGLAKKSKK